MCFPNTEYQVSVTFMCSKNVHAKYDLKEFRVMHEQNQNKTPMFLKRE